MTLAYILTVVFVSSIGASFIGVSKNSIALKIAAVFLFIFGSALTIIEAMLGNALTNI
jgi:hypothetical protein